MAPKIDLPPLIAVDANVALDFSNGREVVIDALITIRQRIGRGALYLPPTVVAELAHAADFSEDSAHRGAARRVLQQHRAWGFRLLNYVPIGQAMVSRIAERLREQRLLPPRKSTIRSWLRKRPCSVALFC